MANEMRIKQRDKLNFNVLYTVILLFLWLSVKWAHLF